MDREGESVTVSCDGVLFCEADEGVVLVCEADGGVVFCVPVRVLPPRGSFGAIAERKDYLVYVRLECRMYVVDLPLKR